MSRPTCRARARTLPAPRCAAGSARLGCRTAPAPPGGRARRDRAQRTVQVRTAILRAAAACGHLGVVRQGADGSEALRRLRVGHHDAVRRVDAGKVLVVAAAGLEGAVLRVVGGVVHAADAVVDVLAIIGRVGAGGITGLEAELVAAHETERRDVSGNEGKLSSVN